jgi:hypothetical protein
MGVLSEADGASLRNLGYAKTNTSSRTSLKKGLILRELTLSSLLKEQKLPRKKPLFCGKFAAQAHEHKLMMTLNQQ